MAFLIHLNEKIFLIKLIISFGIQGSVFKSFHIFNYIPQRTPKVF